MCKYTYDGWNRLVAVAHAYRDGSNNVQAGQKNVTMSYDGRGRGISKAVTNAGQWDCTYHYHYDADGNRLYRDNAQGDAGAATFDELYHANDDGMGDPEGYDKLDRLVAFKRGTLNGSNNAISGTASRTQDWSLDALGNWESITEATGGFGGGPQNRTHNRQNQITSGGNSYDGNGNLTSGGNSYDAWNRLAKHTVGDDTTPYGYDALGRRISVGPTTHSQSSPEEDAVNLYYSIGWQVIHERAEVEGGGGSSGTIGGNEESFGPDGALMSIQQSDYVWSLGYVDAMVLRDRDMDLDGSLEQRLYVQQDANFNVTALINTSGALVERFIYAPYGSPTFLDPTTWAVDSGGSDYDWIYLHQGLRYETHSATYDNRMRPAYDPALGRFWSQDPIRYGDGMSLYQYVGSNPTSLNDPSGLYYKVIWHSSPFGGVILEKVWIEVDPRKVAILNRAPTTRPVDKEQDQKDAKSKNVNCRKWAFNRPDVGRLIAGGDKKAMDAALKSNESFKKYTDDEIAELGGRATNKNDPVPQGLHKISVYRRVYVTKNDFHYATQDNDGTWSEKETEKNPAENLKDPDDNGVWKGKTTVIGYYLVPGPPRDSGATP